MNKAWKFVKDHKKEILGMFMYVGEKLISDQINKREIMAAVKDQLKKG